MRGRATILNMIRIVRDNPGIIERDLARELGASRATVSDNIRVYKTVFEKRRDERDQRIVHVYLNPLTEW